MAIACSLLLNCVWVWWGCIGLLTGCVWTHPCIPWSSKFGCAQFILLLHKPAAQRAAIRAKTKPYSDHQLWVGEGGLEHSGWEDCGCKQPQSWADNKKGTCWSVSWHLDSLVCDGPRAQVSLWQHVGQGTASCVTAVLGAVIKDSNCWDYWQLEQLAAGWNSWFPCPCEEEEWPTSARGLSSSTLQWLARLFSVRDRDKGFSWDREIKVLGVHQALATILDELYVFCRMWGVNQVLDGE